MADITIPREALQRAWETYLLDGCGPHAFEAACLAMLKSWPGMYDEKDTPWSKASTIHLPLTQESGNE